MNQEREVDMTGIAPVRLQPKTLITLMNSYSPWPLPGTYTCQPDHHRITIRVWTLLTDGYWEV